MSAITSSIRRAVASSVQCRPLWRGAFGLSLALSVGCSLDTSGDAPGGRAGASAAGQTNAGTSSVAGSASAGTPAMGGTASGGTASSGGTTGGGGATPVGAGGQAGGSGAGGAGAGGNGGAAGAGGGAEGAGGGAAGGEMKSAGCGKTRTLQDGTRMVQSGGAQRSYILRAPTPYDNNHPYRLMLDFHGATGKGSDLSPSFFGLWDLSAGSTIFVAPDAVGGIWNADTDTKMVSDLLTQLQADLCIDTSRIELEGFSQGGAMTWTLACALPGTFRVAVVHSGGGLAMPKTCQPIPFFSTLGTDGSGQGMSSDYFAMTNGCTVEALPMAPTGGHACSDYKNCTPNHPTRWCDYDAGHTPSPTDAGQNKSWVPQEVWSFVKQF